MHFAIKPHGGYATMAQLLEDYKEMLDVNFPLVREHEKDTREGAVTERRQKENL
jgi:hypothetical protein